MNKLDFYGEVSSGTSRLSRSAKRNRVYAGLFGIGTVANAAVIANEFVQESSTRPFTLINGVLGLYSFVKMIESNEQASVASRAASQVLASEVIIQSHEQALNNQPPISDLGNRF
jgi:hypothetical protein